MGRATHNICSFVGFLFGTFVQRCVTYERARLFLIYRFRHTDENQYFRTDY